MGYAGVQFCEKPADAVFEMNDEIAFVQFAEIDLRAVAPRLLGPLQSPPPMRREAAEEFRRGEDDRLPSGKQKPRAERSFERSTPSSSASPMISRKRSISPSVWK